MEIIALTEQHIQSVLTIYRKCAAFHAKEGFYQWDENYPNLNTIEFDLKNGLLFGGFIANKLVAVISITGDEPIEYHNLTWTSKKPYKIIHRLCVDTDYQRQGIAKKMMGFAEEYCLSNSISAIRLDTFTPNKGAIKFYTKLNYIKTGEVNFPKRKDNTYTCFEKIL